MSWCVEIRVKYCNGNYRKVIKEMEGDEKTLGNLMKKKSQRTISVISTIWSLQIDEQIFNENIYLDRKCYKKYHRK